MRTHAHVIAPALPLVYALRLSWGEPRTLIAANSTAKRLLAFPSPAAAFSKRRPLPDNPCPRLGSRLLPWAHALPLDDPVTQPRTPRVLNSMGKDGDLELPVSGVCGPRWQANATTTILWERNLVHLFHGNSVVFLAFFPP